MVNKYKQIVIDFINAINEHDIDRICLLITDDHEFIDAHGVVSAGKDKMRNGWIAYFIWFPDYNIEINEIFEKTSSQLQTLKKGTTMYRYNYRKCDFIAIYGFASGTYKGFATEDNRNHFRIPASWKAIIEENKIKLWQIYCDTKIPYDIIEKNK